MLRFLVLAQVRHHVGPALLALDNGGNVTHHAKQFKQQRLIIRSEGCKRRDVLLRYHHNVHGPMRSGVVKRENLAGFPDNSDRSLTREGFVAIKVVRQSSVYPSAFAISSLSSFGPTAATCIFSRPRSRCATARTCSAVIASTCSTTESTDSIAFLLINSSPLR